jgi:hypothetical protein
VLAVQLHKELASRGCTPDMLEHEKPLPGGFTLVQTAYLDPDDGWFKV